MNVSENARPVRTGLLGIVLVLVMFSLLHGGDAEARRKKGKGGGKRRSSQVALRNGNNNLLNSLNGLGLLFGGVGGAGFGLGAGGFGLGSRDLNRLARLGALNGGFNGFNPFTNFGAGTINPAAFGLGGFGNGGFGNGFGGFGNGFGNGFGGQQQGGLGDGLQVIANTDGAVGINKQGKYFELDPTKVKDGQLTVAPEQAVRQEIVSVNGQPTTLGTAAKLRDETTAVVNALIDGTLNTPKAPGADGAMNGTRRRADSL